MKRKNGALATAAAVGVGALIWTSVALSTSASASTAAAAKTVVVPAKMTISGSSISPMSPLGQPLTISSANFGDQQGPSGSGGGVAPIEFAPLVVTLPGGPVQAQLGEAYGQPLTVTVDLPDGHSGGYVEYVFSNATLSSTKTGFVSGHSNSLVTLQFAYGSERVTAH